MVSSTLKICGGPFSLVSFKVLKSRFASTRFHSLPLASTRFYSLLLAYTRLHSLSVSGSVGGVAHPPHLRCAPRSGARKLFFSCWIGRSGFDKIVENFDKIVEIGLRCRFFRLFPAAGPAEPSSQTKRTVRLTSDRTGPKIGRNLPSPAGVPAPPQLRPALSDH